MSSDHHSKYLAEENKSLILPVLEENITYIRKAFVKTDDLYIREILLANKRGVLIFLETMAETETIERTLLIPLKKSKRKQNIDNLITNVEKSKTNVLKEVVTELINGACVLLLEGELNGYVFQTPKEHLRSPEEPENEKIVRGSHQGFIESLDVNLYLIRSRLRSPNFKINYLQLGDESKSKIAILYLDNIANPEMVEEVKRRVSSISIDSIIAPGYIEEAIEEYPLSPFPQNLFTERPDRLKAHLMEGRIAIMVEGSADAIILPVTFFSFFQSPDDYNSRYYEGSFFRILRIVSFFGALILPALYVAIVGFHFEIIPFDMITLMKSSTERVPFPPFSEALLMVITIELIREAGIRLPSPIGQTIGIVGGLIIGDAVVNAGLVSNLMVIVIALTAIMSFAISSYEIGNVVRILSFPILIGASTLGFVGIVFSLLIIVIHMCKLETLGVPYLSPFSPFNKEGIKDSLVRFPLWLLNRRSKNLHPKIELRQKQVRGWDQDD